MVTRKCKRRRYEKIMVNEGFKVKVEEKGIISKASTNLHFLPLLELPVHIICDIISRLPLKIIFRCKCVCKMLLDLLKDPYFSKIHLTIAPTLTSNIILEENIRKCGSLHFFTCDLSEYTLTSYSTDDQNTICSTSSGLPTLNKGNAEFTFRTDRLTLIGSCNGLLCLYFNLSSELFYAISNPILGEFLKLPLLKSASSGHADHSGFGYCPKMKQYKVIRFMHPNPTDTTKIVAAVHTLGSDSWRILSENGPSLKLKSFDPFLNGALHWITTSIKPSELICSFSLERETFVFVPPPSHFDAQYVKKVSWINIGVLKGCLCICFTYEDIEFEVWAMREYGVQDSWRKEFRIDMSFYCQLRVVDLHKPVKLFNNGDFLFISSFNSLVSFNPRKRTFRELWAVGRWRRDISAHDLSFVSIKDIAGVRSSKVLNYRVGKIRLLGPHPYSLIL